MVDLSLDSSIHAMVMFFFEWRGNDYSCIQCRIPLHFNGSMISVVSSVCEEEEGGGVGSFEAPIGEVGRVWEGFDDEVEDE